MSGKLLAGSVLAAALALTGCVTSETRPIPKVEAKQATVHIPEAELLDVGIRVFDPGIPENLKDNEEALAKKRIYPDLRKAEARYIPTLLRETLEATAQWGAVRVIPEQCGIRRRHRHRPADRLQRRLPGHRRHGERRGRARVDQGQALFQPRRSRRLQDQRFDEGARSVPERLLRNRQRHGAGAREADRARPREHPQGRQPALRRGPGARRHGGHDRQGQERRHAGGAPAGRRRPDARAHREDPRARHRRGRHGQRLLRELPRQRWKTRTAAGARPASPSSRRKCAHAPRRARAPCSAPRRCIASIFAPNSCSTYDSCRIDDARAQRRHDGRHRRHTLGHEEICRCPHACRRAQRAHAPASSRRSRRRWSKSKVTRCD